MPDHVRHQDEHEQREHEREELHPLGAGGAAQRVGDELVGHLGDRLQPARAPARATRCAPTSAAAIRPTRDQHEQRRIGEGDLDGRRCGRSVKILLISN